MGRSTTAEEVSRETDSNFIGTLRSTVLIHRKRARMLFTLI